MADVDSVIVTWRATMMVGLEEETLTLHLPEWMDEEDARHNMHRECADVYGTRGVILLIERL